MAREKKYIKRKENHLTLIPRQKDNIIQINLKPKKLPTHKPRHPYNAESSKMERKGE